MTPSNKSKAVKGSASICALLGTASINAAIVTNSQLGLSGFTVGNDNPTQSWNIDNTGSSEVTIASSASLFVDFISAGNGFQFRGSGSAIQNIGFDNYVITGGFDGNGEGFGILSQGSIGNAIGFTSGDPGYMGFQFNPSGTVLFGWAEVILTEGGNTGTFTVVQWAYEDTGANIKSGAIPEPSTVAAGLGALALGAAGLRSWRKRKA